MKGFVRARLKGFLKNCLLPLALWASPALKRRWEEYQALKLKNSLGAAGASLTKPASEAEPLKFTFGPGGEAWRPPRELFPPFYFGPLNCLAAALEPKINLLLPSISAGHTSGGPNTAYTLAAELVKKSYPVRLIAVTLPADADGAPIRRHIAALGGLTGEQAERIELMDASDRARPVRLGRSDIFIATAWWTAQMIKYIPSRFEIKEFVYLIQDFEPLIHNASANYALALETYALPMLPIFNSSLLRDHFLAERPGRFADPGFAASALCFEPALDRAVFYPATRAAKAKKRLLFYARPEASRNLLEIGLGALMKVLAEGHFDPSLWDFFSSDIGVGGSCLPVRLADSPEVLLRPLPLPSLGLWAEELRKVDIMLSLILSPHTSYPPLEAAASGALVATNTWSVKTEARLRALSPNIIAGPPTIEGVAAALARAARSSPAAGSPVALPATWSRSWEPLLPDLLDFFSRRGLRAP